MKFKGNFTKHVASVYVAMCLLYLTLQIMTKLAKFKMLYRHLVTTHLHGKAAVL